MSFAVKLIGDRVCLKKLPKTFVQANEMFELIQKNRSHLFPFADWEIGLNSPEDCFERIVSQHDKWEKGTAYTYGIFESLTGKLLGIIFAGHYTQIGKSTELGYWLDNNHTGKGLMKEAIGLLEKELFKNGIVKIIIKADTENENSAGVAKALGYELEATLKKDQFIHSFNELRDFNVFSKIKEE